MSMARKKRSNGDGSFYQLPDKTWMYQVWYGRWEDGTPHRKAFRGKTQAICKQKREAWEAQQAEIREEETAVMGAMTPAAAAINYPVYHGHSLESEVLFKDAYLAWLKLYKSPPTRKPSTYSGYLDLYEDHFAEYFGELPLYAITQDVVQEYYLLKQMNGARKDGKPGGLSPKSLRNHHMNLKDFFRYAQKKYRLEQNPTLDTTRPEVCAPNPRVLTPEEMRVFIEEVMKESQRAAILTCLLLGLRVGELLALEIGDLNLKEQKLHINKDLVRVKTEAISHDNPNIRILLFDPSKKTHLIVQNMQKTKSSNRQISLSDDCCELLLRHIFTMAHSSCPNPNGLLFPSKKGTHLDPKSYERRLTAVSKRCEIKKVNPHALRHTLATRLVEEHTPLNIVKDILGHSSITTTQKYLHGNEELERDALRTISDYLDMDKLVSSSPMSGAWKPKFSDIRLPQFK